ncbi:hypothetical protein GQ42DRAFT_86931 [Ramicandelaber brevisporus]|nr:hypothetical protein GQ42DRAFT_86931 [Ramicandelaber brevisporus]
MLHKHQILDTHNHPAMFIESSQPENEYSWSSRESDLHLIESSSSVVAAGIDRLFVLPYDLLEEIATAYLSRHEAAALLTVNSQFLAACSRVVWHKLNTQDKLVDSVPDTAWRKYGHLVRCARINLNQLNAQLCTKTPSLAELTLHFTSLRFDISDGVELLNLRRIAFITHESRWEASDAMKCMDLVRQLEHRNKYLLIYWDIVLMMDEHVSALNSIINRADNPARYSLSITYLVPRALVLTRFSKLLQMLVKLNISCNSNRFNDFFNHNDGNNSSTEYTFPRLNTLQLRSHYGLNQDELLESILTPVHFPSLTNIQFTSLLNSTFGLPGFSASTNHSWLTVTELRLLSSSGSDSVHQALKKVPNLERLILVGCKLKLEIAHLAKNLPRLKYFELGTMVWLGDSRSYSIHNKMTSLKDIVFRLREDYDNYYDYVTSRQLLLEFIFSGSVPGLRCLEFRGNRRVDWSLNSLKRSSQANNAVCTLILPDEHSMFGANGAPALSTMFPNLKFLQLRECTDTTRKRLAKEYPHLVITVEPL